MIEAKKAIQLMQNQRKEKLWKAEEDNFKLQQQALVAAREAAAQQAIQEQKKLQEEVREVNEKTQEEILRLQKLAVQIVCHFAISKIALLILIMSFWYL